MNIIAIIKKLRVMIFCSFLLFEIDAQVLSGRVIDEDGKGIKGASVSLVVAGLSDTSGDDGSFSIPVPTGIEPVVRKWLLPEPIIKGTTFYFAINKKNEQVRIAVYSLNGRLIYQKVHQNLLPGIYSFHPFDHSFHPNIYAVKLQIGNKVNHFKVLVTGRQNNTGISSVKSNIIGGRLEKRMVTVDTVRVAKSGYTPVSEPISTYENSSLNITLKKYVPSYHLNPPDPCYNQFYVDNCIPGDPNSACGGNCRVANSCSPPEDPSKADLPKTFICPRFMLFSTEMLQAAKDDAAFYGWGNSEDPPFNYGVVGHDPDAGGVDDGPSSCCQCYQIVFVNPEPSSPKPPELPYPKPLIVQSFNTAASGPKGFDVFMGAGGYGAFNSCYKDPAFSNTSKFNEFIYDEYPYQNPGSGGISFLRYQECIKGWPPIVDGILSSACQEKIKEMCDQALVNASEQITEDTRRSCIETNKLHSLYHQNWEVMVKRVRCPDNLTRVTGCRLKEDHLPLPHPEVQTPADAKKEGSFREGYHTTTMQDCCKPTCAWSDWTEDYKLPVDGEWNSFYSCDKNGVPFTKK
jgi:hypothetical protein